MDNKQIIRVCKECNEVKPINKFDVSRIKDDKKYYKHKCAVCVRNHRKSYFKKYYLENKDKYYQKKPKNETQ
jgi:hypothetical protein